MTDPQTEYFLVGQIGRPHGVGGFFLSENILITLPVSGRI